MPAGREGMSTTRSVLWLIPSARRRRLKTDMQAVLPLRVVASVGLKTIEAKEVMPPAVLSLADPRCAIEGIALLSRRQSKTKYVGHRCQVLHGMNNPIDFSYDNGRMALNSTRWIWAIGFFLFKPNKAG